MFPGRRHDKGTDRDCIRREMKEELPNLKLGRLQLWKEVMAKNKISGRKMSDAIFIAKTAKGRLDIGDKKEQIVRFSTSRGVSGSHPPRAHPRQALSAVALSVRPALTNQSLG
ncbi:hypothetical protein NWI01_25090 [Nitrobacter winogradskyi]|uniref:Uncharacterized protein n=2 Tax=Nitrobacter winogradskyi TaxID=913 RepID=A0A4Y3WC63_NITWI|nr:hypothetical protein NWI01_25090 [Nitrobacter winogradskyi]